MSNRDEMRDVNRLVPSEETLVGRLQAENAALRGAVTPGNLLDHEYRAAGSPRGWTWVEAIRMWRRQQDIECDEWRQRAEAAEANMLRVRAYATTRIEQLEAGLRRCRTWLTPLDGIVSPKDYPMVKAIDALLAAQPPEE